MRLQSWNEPGNPLPGGAVPANAFMRSARFDLGSAASLGALTLHLDFLDLFLSLLRFTGRRR